MTTAVQIEEDSENVKKNITHILDQKIFSSATKLPQISEVALALSAASGAEKRLQSSVTSQMYLNALGNPHEHEDKQWGFAKSQIAEILGHEQALTNIRLADMQGMLSPKDNRQTMLDSFANSQASAADAVKAFSLDIGPPIDIARSFQATLSEIERQRCFIDFTKIELPQISNFTGANEAILASINNAAENARSTFFDSIDHYLEKSHSALLASVYNSTNIMCSGLVANMAQSIENINTRFADVVAGIVTPAQMASRFALPEYISPFTRSGRFFEPEQVEVQISKAGVYIEVEPDQPIEAVHIADMDWQVIMSAILKTGKATAQQVISFAEHFTSKDKPGPQEPSMEIKIALNDMYETLKRKHGNGMTQGTFVAMYAGKIWACSLSSFERYRRDVKRHRKNRAN